MKSILVWMFCIITLMGAFSQASSACVETPVPSNQNAEDSIQDSRQAGAENSDLDQSKQQASTCDHREGACHVCHLGHCAFLLSSSISIDSVIHLHQVALQPVIIIDFHTNLYRPPILV